MKKYIKQDWILDYNFLGNILTKVHFGYGSFSTFIAEEVYRWCLVCISKFGTSIKVMSPTFNWGEKNFFCLATCISNLERTDNNTSIYTTNQCWHTLKHHKQPLKPKTCHIWAISVCIWMRAHMQLRCKWDWTDFWTKFEFDYFRKNTQQFSMCFKQIIFRLKFIVCSDEIYIDLKIHLACSKTYLPCIFVW